MQDDVEQRLSLVVGLLTRTCVGEEASRVTQGEGRGGLDASYVRFQVSKVIAVHAYVRTYIHTYIHTPGHVRGGAADSTTDTQCENGGKQSLEMPDCIYVHVDGLFEAGLQSEWERRM